MRTGDEDSEYRSVVECEHGMEDALERRQATCLVLDDEVRQRDDNLQSEYRRDQEGPVALPLEPRESKEYECIQELPELRVTRARRAAARRAGSRSVIS